MSLFLPITKVDALQRLVYGTISEEVPDKAGEILDYASSKPAFEEWSRQFSEASGGKSLGNVRAMHSSIAAGKLTDIQYDDAARRIDGVAKIVDDDEWEKVLEGVYTGFSIGGGYARRWPDKDNPALMRYTPVLAEVSLVDNPAVPTATFQLVRSDGSVELRKFLAPDDTTTVGPLAAAQLLAGLGWLADHAKTIGASGLLAHINALRGYLEETDEGDYITPLNTEKSVGQGDALRQHIDRLQKRIAQLEAQPMSPRGALRLMDKSHDYHARPLPAAKEPASIHDLMKAALANPLAM